MQMGRKNLAWTLVDLHQNQMNSLRLVCVNIFFKEIVHLERIAILLTVSTNCDNFLPKETGMGTSELNRVLNRKFPFDEREKE